MRISVIADTHDNMPYIKSMIKKINKINPDLVIHCGDFNAPFAAEPYINLKSPLIAVYGNNDAEKYLIKEKLEQAGKKVRGYFASVKIDNRKIAVTHGDDYDLLQTLISSKIFDAVLHGHTHQVNIEDKDGVLLFNPGEVCGYLTGKNTFGTIDTASLHVKITKL